MNESPVISVVRHHRDGGTLTKRVYADGATSVVWIPDPDGVVSKPVAFKGLREARS